MYTYNVVYVQHVYVYMHHIRIISRRVRRGSATLGGAKTIDPTTDPVDCLHMGDQSVPVAFADAIAIAVP
jgi:hypothetical protein